MISFGTSYFGTYDPDKAREDIEKMSYHFDWVVVPMSEELAAFQKDNIAKIVALAGAHNMRTYLGTWGLAGIFGGEGLSAAKGECISSCAVGNRVEAWVKAAIEISPTGILWDEPHEPSCTCSSVAFLDYWIDRVRMYDPKLKHWLYAREEWWPQELDLESVKYIESFGMDLYNIDVITLARAQTKINLLKGATTDAVQWVEHGENPGPLKNPDPHVWIQGHNIRKESVEDAVDFLEYAIGSGVDRIGIWGYDGAKGMSVLRSDPAWWPRVLQAIDEYKETVPPAPPPLNPVGKFSWGPIKKEG